MGCPSPILSRTNLVLPQYTFYNHYDRSGFGVSNYNTVSMIGIDVLCNSLCGTGPASCSGFNTLGYPLTGATTDTIKNNTALFPGRCDGMYLKIGGAAVCPTPRE